ncbi:hypothetical protein O1611_g73 [Lasiodiplodia mahajangana]|uniref:Uncharacterized protein n=1 Tax=Lasiodiplodia mahajangana TaxID=1108764 RepID=A0ACC2K196_9PEZI|nr:hypothetical protein O1611_g73 [Lasiodiplodia mahajangana]
MAVAPIPVPLGEFDSNVLAGKTAIVTGGASGIGQAYVRALARENVYVVIADRGSESGKRLESEVPRSKFVQTDVTKWEDQSRLFEEAVAFSPTKAIHYVIANAGIAPADEVFTYEEDGPTKPDLTTIDVNLVGVLYSAKLSLHYFVKQNGMEAKPDQEDTCLVLIGSGAAFLDVPRGPQYPATKWGIRGIMHSMRRTAFYYGSRVNVISPWYIRTPILSKEKYDHVENSGVELAEASDAGKALVHLLSDKTINGRSFFISPRKWASEGYCDLGLEELPPNKLLEEIQKEQIQSSPIEDGLFTQ